MKKRKIMKKILLITILLLGYANADITTAEGAKKACDRGNAQGCFNLGLMYTKGQGVKQDDFKAKELFGKACDGEVARGCTNYSILNKR